MRLLIMLALLMNGCAFYPQAQDTEPRDACEAWAALAEQCGDHLAPEVQNCRAWMDYFECSEQVREWLTASAELALESGWCLDAELRCVGDGCPPDEEWAGVLRINYCGPPALRERVDEYGVPVQGSDGCWTYEEGR